MDQQIESVPAERGSDVSVPAAPAAEALARLFGALGARVGAKVRPHSADDVQHLRAAIDASNDAIFVVDIDSARFVDVSDGVTRMLGYTRAELLKLGPTDIMPGERGALIAHYRNLIDSGLERESTETEFMRKDGRALPVQLGRYPLEVNGRWSMIGVARDLSDVRRVDAALAESRGMYQSLFDLNP